MPITSRRLVDFSILASSVASHQAYVLLYGCVYQWKRKCIVLVMLSVKMSSLPMPHCCQKWEWTRRELLLRQTNQMVANNRKKRKRSQQKAENGNVAPWDLCAESYTCLTLPWLARHNGAWPQKRLAGNGKPPATWWSRPGSWYWRRQVTRTLSWPSGQQEATLGSSGGTERAQQHVCHNSNRPWELYNAQLNIAARLYRWLAKATMI